MNGPQFKVAEIFDAAVELETPEERAAFLESACGADADLRAEVEQLLRHDQEAGNFLIRSAMPGLIATTDEPVSEWLGTVIGTYQLLEQIGEGGFGVVFMAEQTQPVRRKVALKLIKPGMDSRQVIARFEAERQALALMDHANIARVFDGGETASGRPYFVMELVRGIPITNFCDQARLSPRERLTLFASVCQAVQHAHQKGIIHRDLKPSNVLVALHDDKPAVKVIDFGVAKALGQELTDKTLFTSHAQLIGTPPYMSPEQAEQSGLDIDTRTDIYSLGVLLYELLTGTTPFSKERAKNGNYDAIRRMIREEEPPRPSARISELSRSGLPGGTALQAGAIELSKIAAARRTEPVQLGKLLRGDLDWIVMKALEKDRTRRYDNASALATDIERYLHDETVAAGPPSTWYRLSKFARRNRGAMLAAALVSTALLTVVIILGVSTVLIAQERDRAQQAAQNEAQKAEEASEQRSEAETQRREAEIQRRQAEQERQRAEKNLQRAREAVDRFFTRAAKEMKDKPHMEQIRRALLEDALKFYQGFLEEKGTDPVIRHETARAYLRVAQVQHYLSNTSQVEAPARSAIALLKQLIVEHPAKKEYQQDLAEAHATLASTLDYQVHIEEALAEFQKELAVWEHLAADFPTVADYRWRVADGHGALGHTLLRLMRYEEAEREFRSAQTLADQLHRAFPKEPKARGTVWGDLGGLFALLNRLPEAEHAWREEVRLEGENTSGWARIELARALVDNGKPEEAERLYRQALAVREKLVDDFPSVPSYRRQVWLVNTFLADMLCATNRAKEAEEVYRRGVVIAEKMLADQPHDVKLPANLGNVYNSLGWLLHATNRPQEAADAFRRAQELYEKAVAERPQAPICLFNLADFLANCPATQFRDPSRAVQVAQKVLQRSPSFYGWSAFASALYRVGKWNEAIEAIHHAMELDKGGRSWDLFLLAMAHWQRGDPKEARKCYDKAVAGMKKYPLMDERLRQAEAAALLGVAELPTAKENALPAGKK
jgi:serine/threonine protein kinase/tetratricopeptide (TPR) repeat protein